MEMCLSIYGEIEMEDQGSVARSDASLPGQNGANQYWRPPIADPIRCDDAVPRKLEWIAIILFGVNLFMMMYLYSLLYREEAWGLFAIAVSTATAVILLLSFLFSIFGKTDLSKYAIGGGVVGLMISVVSFGVRLMQRISEYNDRWFL